ncbi:MAG: hypothetical protein QOE43_2612 [Gaiellaceae bacterium]|nr:hypothetical protein [Gaiellaceae bacterium]
MRWARRLAFVGFIAAAATLALATSARAVPVPWCGTGEPTTDLPDSVSAFEWHVVYAVPAGGVDSFAGFAPRIAGDAATVSAWWLGQDSTRRPRYDLIDAPACGSEYGRLDISLVHVPAGVSTFEGIVEAVRAAGFADPDKGYLVYFDGSLHVGTEYGVCGESSLDDVAFAYSIVYLQTCGQVASDDTRAVIAIHEMTHGMGAVPSEAPHSCDSGHVCDSANDLMKAVFESEDTLANLQLDVGRDDYYRHSGNWWDVVNSGLLYDLDQSLAAAPDIVNFTATSNASFVRADWAPSTLQPGLYYRVYDENGKLTNEDQETTTITTSGTLGEIFTWTVRAATAGGFLSRPATLHFKVGYGTVDASGVLLRDTVRPAAVTRLRVSISGAKAVLRWSKVGDPIGLRGYRISGPGLRPLVVSGTTASFPRSRVRGKTVSVAAVDRSGNVGAAATARIR